MSSSRSSCRQAGSDANSSDAFALLDLGRQAPPANLSPQATPPAPIVRAYLDRLEAAGVDWRPWLGGSQAISGVFCISGDDPNGGECLQYFPNQRLHWPRGTTDPQQVRLSQLGREASRP